jgi:hypothetical protein
MWSSLLEFKETFTLFFCFIGSEVPSPMDLVDSDSFPVVGTRTGVGVSLEADRFLGIGLGNTFSAGVCPTSVPVPVVPVVPAVAVVLEVLEVVVRDEGRPVLGLNFGANPGLEEDLSVYLFHN